MPLHSQNPTKVNEYPVSLDIAISSCEGVGQAHVLFCKRVSHIVSAGRSMAFPLRMEQFRQFERWQDEWTVEEMYTSRSFA